MYQPKGPEAEGPATDRSFTGVRYGSMKEVSASVDVSNSKFAEALKSKYAIARLYQ